MPVTDAVIVGLIAAIPATLLGVAALITAIKGNRKTDALAVSVDGRLSQLLESKAAENQATGHAAGVESERMRVEEHRPLP
jgi:hypothetical protein